MLYKRGGQAYSLDQIVDSLKRVAKSRGRRQTFVFVEPRKNSICISLSLSPFHLYAINLFLLDCFIYLHYLRRIF